MLLAIGSHFHLQGVCVKEVEASRGNTGGTWVEGKRLREIASERVTDSSGRDTESETEREVKR